MRRKVLELASVWDELDQAYERAFARDSSKRLMDDPLMKRWIDERKRLGDGPLADYEGRGPPPQDMVR